MATTFTKRHRISKNGCLISNNDTYNCNKILQLMKNSNNAFDKNALPGEFSVKKQND